MVSRSRKMTLIFLFSIFVLLAFFLGSWLYKIYLDQTAYTEEQSMATLECGRFYFDIDDSTVRYDNGTLSFEIENTIGAPIRELTVESALETQTLNISGLIPGAIVPVTTQIRITDWVHVYPRHCQGLNWKNLTFLPNIET